ncbi:hypothetical protein LXA43DRAFT_1097204 [Ganoderma leucocontextum]|nr:hypothetical protein LXA43DRAFT_1097204 [Ganoderma leucocontextum]
MAQANQITPSASPNAIRTILPDSEDLWHIMKVEVCKALLLAWSGQKVPWKSRKGDLVAQLLDTKVSVSWDRVFGWFNDGVSDPGPGPQDGIAAREWDVDRTLLVQMLRMNSIMII